MKATLLGKRMPRGAVLVAAIPLVAICAIGVNLIPAAASALPTASFLFSPVGPAVGDPVTLTFTGACDEPPCRVQWRWFQDGGSSLGTSMGEGDQIQYAFGAAGDYSVVVKITNALPTHGSATSTQVIRVHDTTPPPPSTPPAPFSASMAVGPSEPAAGQPVRFTFTGACDAPPCVLRWRWLDSRGGLVDEEVGDVTGAHAAPLRSFSQSGHYSAVVSATNANNESVDASQRFFVADGVPTARSGLVQDRSLALGLDRWAGRTAADTRGGGYRTGHGKAALHFTGSRVGYVARTGPLLGIAELSVDGHVARRVDLYSAEPGLRRWTLHTGAGRHVLVVSSVGAAGAGLVSTAVSVDEFIVHRAGRVRHVDDASVRVSYGGWSGDRAKAASGRTLLEATRTGAKVHLVFTGTKIRWVTRVGPHEARARITVDGGPPVIIDNTARAAARQVWTLDRLPGGLHHLTLTVLSPTRARPVHLVVDAFRVS